MELNKTDKDVSIIETRSGKNPKNKHKVKTKTKVKKSSTQSKKKKKMSTKAKVGYSLLGLLVVATVSVVAMGAYLYNAANKISQPTATTKRINTLKKDDDYMVNFLIMGDDNDDERSENEVIEGDRTDTLMLVSLNTKTEKVTMYNIPRDTTTVIYDKDNNPVPYLDTEYVTKINAAYDFGAEEATVNTVEHLFPGIHIDYYWTFNFISFKGIVNALGGIEMDVPTDIYDYKLEKLLVNAGPQTLNGEQALDVARARYQDNDIERGYRQQMVMEAIARKLSSDVTVTQALKILASVQDNVTTDMHISDITALYEVAIKKDWEFDRVETNWGSYNLGVSSMVYLPNDSIYDVVKQINESIERPYDEANVIKDGTSLLHTQLNYIQQMVELNGKTEWTFSEMNQLFGPVLYPNEYPDPRQEQETTHLEGRVSIQGSYENSDVANEDPYYEEDYNY